MRVRMINVQLLKTHHTTVSCGSKMRRSHVLPLSLTSTSGLLGNRTHVRRHDEVKIWITTAELCWWKPRPVDMPQLAIIHILCDFTDLRIPEAE